MDPITAIGFAANILSFIDYSAKVIAGAIEIYDSASSTTEECRSSETIVTEMRRFAARLQPLENAQLSGEERALCNLATECASLAKQIVDLLEKIKPKSRKSKASSLYASVKAKMYDGERRRLEEQLSHCRAQLDLQLNYLTSSEIQARLDALVISAKNDSSKLEYLHNQAEHLRRGVAVECLTAGAQTQLQSLLGMSKHACEVIVQHRILGSIAFDGMHTRYETVDDAHFRTLRWIFNDNLHDGQLEDEAESAPSSEDEAKASARESLLNWLSTGTGIFHIAGKLGSGKSTLMKYLCEHDRTKLLLGQWAGHRHLVFASFFFWKPGPTLQKSITGLTRSLLHDALKACPELIQDTLPDYWAQIQSTPWQVRNELPLSDNGIRAAFERLISNRKLYMNHCFCFFIDGLDEYEGTHQHDTKTLVDLLSSWTNLAPETVKICVSSREYNMFMNAFSIDQRIRLHDLTRSDMTRYVLDKLRHMDREGDKSTLTKAIVENAQGIFVWVALVVKRIREQIENGANLDALEREIYALPKELDGLFEHILNSLVDSDLKAAYQTFSMLFELDNSDLHLGGLSLSLLSYSFLNDYTQDPIFALREDFRRRFVDREARARRIECARKQLNGCCRGLVEVRHGEDGDIIRITHRSVFEFLSSRTQKDQMERYLNGFNRVDAISQLTIAELWSRDPGQISLGSNLDCMALSLVYRRIKVKLDEPPYSFLVSLAFAWERHQDAGNHDCDGNQLTIYTWNSYSIIDVISRSSTDRPNHSRPFQILRHPIYPAALHGNYDFVQWELERNTAAIPHFTPLRLLYCILKNRECTTPQGMRDMMDCLYTHGIRPQTVSSLVLTFLYPVMNDIQKNDSNLGDENTEVSLWHHILLRCFRYEITAAIKTMHGLGYVVEKFLEYGADPYFFLSVTNDPDPRVRLVVRVGKERQEQWLKILPFGSAPYECQDMSLRDLVERWGFENKARILELIEENALMLEVAAEDEVIPLSGEEQSAEDVSATLRMVDLAAGDNVDALPTEPMSAAAEIPVDSNLPQDSLAAVAGFRSQKLLSLVLNSPTYISILVLGVVVALLIPQLYA